MAKRPSRTGKPAPVRLVTVPVCCRWHQHGHHRPCLVPVTYRVAGRFFKRKIGVECCPLLQEDDSCGRGCLTVPL